MSLKDLSLDFDSWVIFLKVISHFNSQIGISGSSTILVKSPNLFDGQISSLCTLEARVSGRFQSLQQWLTSRNDRTFGRNLRL